MPITYDQKYTNFCQLAPIPEGKSMIKDLKICDILLFNESKRSYEITRYFKSYII